MRWTHVFGQRPSPLDRPVADHHPTAGAYPPGSATSRHRDFPPSPIMLPRLQVMMESTLNNMTEHARALEDAAMERHRLRMERSQEAIRVAIQDAIGQLTQESRTLHSAHQSDLQQLSDQHAEKLAVTRDQTEAQLSGIVTQITAQVEQLQAQLKSRLYNGTLVTPPESGDPGSVPTPPQSAPVPPQGTPPGTSSMVPVTAQPNPTGRWSNVNLDF